MAWFYQFFHDGTIMLLFDIKHEKQKGTDWPQTCSHRGNVSVSGKETYSLRNRGLDNTTERKLVFRQLAAMDIETQQGNAPPSHISADILHSNDATTQHGQQWWACVP